MPVPDPTRRAGPGWLKRRAACPPVASPEHQRRPRQRSARRLRSPDRAPRWAAAADPAVPAPAGAAGADVSSGVADGVRTGDDRSSTISRLRASTDGTSPTTVTKTSATEADPTRSQTVTVETTVQPIVTAATTAPRTAISPACRVRSTRMQLAAKAAAMINSSACTPDPETRGAPSTSPIPISQGDAREPDVDRQCPEGGERRRFAPPGHALHRVSVRPCPGEPGEV